MRGGMGVTELPGELAEHSNSTQRVYLRFSCCLEQLEVVGGIYFGPARWAVKPPWPNSSVGVGGRDPRRVQCRAVIWECWGQCRPVTHGDTGDSAEL